MQTSPRYNELTPEERKAHYDAQVAELNAYTYLPGFSAQSASRMMQRCQRDMMRCGREARFIFSVARKCGDEWVKSA